ncbi:hypothetical protein BU25DRAFT_482234 [Macroventuria anomochaeta]|uniref:Uncharacterized protein n=1 Tax=Macroventuria anomochaeta TaxID=301207 RepID=A0ACB6RKT2_9PLEO|nr:uncharacterized protein BU25DRAFT_482234 [Macroventuria anomochaeta]KAF2621764.1 hypothetical protein BU25DRAFT_482234 [Macroventuria anomochaeta]
MLNQSSLVPSISEEQKTRYSSLIQHQVQPYFPRFVKSLVGQSLGEQEHGRCAAIDFTNPQSRQITSFTTATKLESYLTNSPPLPLTAADGTPARRRLFILEDLPRNHILALGSHLRIPPSFFAGHWNDPCSLTFIYRNPFRRCTLPHFRLRYATSNRVEVDAPSGHIDPAPGTQVRCLETGVSYPLRTALVNEPSMPKRFLYLEIEMRQELPEDYSQWAAWTATAGYSSMFDDTMHAFQQVDSNVVMTFDPLSATDFSRKLVISISIAYLRRRYLNLLDIQKSDTVPQIMRQDYLASFSKNSYSSWSSEFFDFIVGSQAAVKVFAREMEDNIIALGLNSFERSRPQWERNGWQTIKKLTAVVAETIDAFANSYLRIKWKCAKPLPHHSADNAVHSFVYSGKYLLHEWEFLTRSGRIVGVLACCNPVVSSNCVSVLVSGASQDIAAENAKFATTSVQ